MNENDKEDKFSDVYAEGKELGKLLDIKDSKDVLKLLKSEDKNNKDFIFAEKFDKSIQEVKEEDYSEIKKALDEICSKLPIRKCDENGVILLDRNNPDDIEWWNEDEEEDIK